jgi:hypothetical protein
MFGNWFIDPAQMDRGEIREISYDKTIDAEFETKWPGILLDVGFTFAYIVGLVSVACAYAHLSSLFYKQGSPDNARCLSRKFIRNFYIGFPSWVAIITLLSLCISALRTGETCSFDRWCHESSTGGLTSSKIYYRLYGEECPEVSVWLKYMYHDENHNEDCENTEYGCCEIWDPERCSTATSNHETYFDYQSDMERNISHWTLEVEKVDVSGSNCPTIEDIIYDVSVENDYHFKFHYVTKFGIYFICMTIFHLSSVFCCQKSTTKPYIATDYGQLDVSETTELNQPKAKAKALQGAV